MQNIVDKINYYFPVFVKVLQHTSGRKKIIFAPATSQAIGSSPLDAMGRKVRTAESNAPVKSRVPFLVRQKRKQTVPQKITSTLPFTTSWRREGWKGENVRQKLTAYNGNIIRG